MGGPAQPPAAAQSGQPLASALPPAAAAAGLPQTGAGKSAAAPLPLGGRHLLQVCEQCMHLINDELFIIFHHIIIMRAHGG